MTTLIHISQDLLTFIKLLVAIVVQLLGLYVGGKKLWKEVKKDLSKKSAKSAKPKKRKELKFE